MLVNLLDEDGKYLANFFRMDDYVQVIHTRQLEGKPIKISKFYGTIQRYDCGFNPDGSKYMIVYLKQIPRTFWNSMTSEERGVQPRGTFEADEGRFMARAT